MDDLISRQAAIDALDVLCQEHRYKIPGKRETYSPYNEAWQDALDRAEGAIGNLPSAQPEQRSFSCGQENDLISRRAAIDKLDPIFESLAIDKIKALPTALPEIIRCKDCKHYIPYDWMFSGLSRSSNINNYFPDDMVCLVNDDNYPPDGFCSKAERKTDEVD